MVAKFISALNQIVGWREEFWKTYKEMKKSRLF